MATIVVVDDRDDDRLLLRTVLVHAGHRVLEASDAVEGIELARSEAPDLIISDVLMPSMDGYSFARELRSDPGTAGTKLLFCTASAGDAGIDELARACGAIGIIPKPSEPQRTIEIVARALASAETASMVGADEFDRDHLRLVNDRLLAKVKELEQANRRVELARAELEVRARQQAAVAELSSVALRTGDIDAFLRSAVSLVHDVLDVDYAGVFELLPGGEELEVRASAGLTDATVGRRIPAGPGSRSGYAVATGHPVIVNGRDDPEAIPVPAEFAGAGVSSTISVPIPGAGRAFGAITAVSVQPAAFLEQEESFITAVAHIVSAAVQRAHGEEVLRRSERLESLGRLAGGIAHDFANILSVVSGFVGLVRKKVDDESIREDLDEALQGARRAIALSRQLLTFARRDVEPSTAIDVGEIAHDMEPMLERAVGSNVELTLATSSAPTKVVGDAGRIEQILLNLAINARDAMPDGGHLTITVEEVVLDDSYALEHAEAQIEPGGFVRITVADDGVGMSEEVMGRVFEPFFTTKPAGVGTGLGLATVYGSAKQMGGHVEIESTPGAGTTLRILLPAEAETEPRDLRVFTSGPPDGSIGAVLVVEDQDQLRELIRRMLAAEGYEVATASNADDALEILRRGPVDVLLTDVVLPGTPGTHLAQLARETKDGLGVVLMSAYAGVGTDEVIGADAIFLRKPFTKEQLLGALASASKRC